MTTPASSAAPGLLSAAAELLERVGELPPISVACDLSASVLAGVLVTPASPAAGDDDQSAVVRGIATAMRWHCRQLADSDGWITSGTVSGVRVEAIAAPMRTPIRDRLTRSTTITTAQHAALLRSLIGWSATLPTRGVAALQVYEDLDSGALRARLSVVDRDVMAQIREVVMTVPDDGWSGYGGTGVLPTGTDLTVSIGRY